MEDISLPSEIIKKLDKMHYNMVANGSWINTNEKDTKIMALNPMVNNMNMKYGALAKKVSFKGEPKPSTPALPRRRAVEKQMTGRSLPRLVALSGR